MNTAGESLLLRGHEDSVYDVAWAPDGARLASASGDGTVRLWSSKGRHLDAVQFGELVHCVAFSSDGDLPAAGTGAGRLVVIKLRSKKVVLERQFDCVEALQFVKSANTLLVGTNDGLLIEVSLGQHSQRQRSIGAPVLSVRASPDERWFAVAGPRRIQFFEDLDADPSQFLSLVIAIAADCQTCAGALTLNRGAISARPMIPTSSRSACETAPRRGTISGGEPSWAHCMDPQRGFFSGWSISGVGIFRHLCEDLGCGSAQ